MSRTIIRLVLAAACVLLAVLAVEARPAPLGAGLEDIADLIQGNKASRGAFSTRTGRPVPTEVDATGPIVETEAGWIQGYADDGIYTYRGVPFAAPPTGNLRWREPQQPANWTGVRPAYSQAQICPQAQIVTGIFLGGEDCLYADVYAPANPTGAPLPVFVWIYGGGYVLGDGWEFGLYDGHNLAKTRGYIVVTFNYRLGALGFMANDALKADNPEGFSGNWGLLDQVQALKWVQNNIASFGGDASRVTIAGESAGAFSVCWHLASPLSSGLFHAAIMESGTCDMAEYFVDYDRSANWTNTYSQMVGCDPDSPNQLACLRGLSTSKAMGNVLGSNSADPKESIKQWHAAHDRVASMPNQKWGYKPTLFPLMPWGATIDGVSLTDVPLNVLASGHFNKVPIIAGTNADEGTIFVPAMFLMIPGVHYPIQPADLPIAYNHLWLGNSTITAGIMAHYPLSAYPSAEDVFNEVVKDFIFVCPTRRALATISSFGVPAHMYHWMYKGDWIEDIVLGDYHSAELEFVFANQWPPIIHAFSSNDYYMADSVDTYWSNLIWHLDPNGNSTQSRTGALGAQEYWAPYDAVSRQNMILAVPTKVERNYADDICAFWDSIDEGNRQGGSHAKPTRRAATKPAASKKPRKVLTEQ